MDRLRCLEVFAEVAKHGSFAVTATRMNMSRASVTKHVAILEHELRGSLLDRTTRRVMLTDMGRETLKRGQPILEAYESLVADLNTARNEVKGLIKVAAPPIFGAKYLLPQITKFCAMHPEIEVALSLFDPAQDFPNKTNDISIGFLSADSETCTSIGLMSFPQVIVAAPSYIEARGLPGRPRDLEAHNCLIHTQKAPNGLWRFMDGTAVTVRGSLRSNNGEAIKQATVLGQGISMFPYYFVEDECRSGALRILLENYPPGLLQFSAIRETRRNLPLRTQRFIGYLKSWSSSEEFPAPASYRGRPARMGAEGG